MALGKRLINTGAVAACTTDSTDPFGDSSGVALYSLDYDASTAPDGTDYSGTPTNVEFGVGGKINYGARFNGSSSKIESNVLQSTNMTFSCWFKTTTTGEREYLMGFNTSGSAGYISTRLNANDTIGIAYWNGSTYAAVSSSAITRDTNYNHICITISGTSYTIYYNGSSIGSGTLSGFSASSRTDFVMGFDAPTGATGYMNGSLDQVRIFSKALSSDEVDSLFAETACVYTATTTDNYYPLADGSSDAVAYYKLDNSSEDYVGSNDGTDTNIEYRFGRFGQAAVFNGSSSVIDINSLATVLDAQNIVSVSFWFKSSATALSGLFSYRGSASSAVNMTVSLNRSATGDIGLDSSTSGAFVTLGTYNGTYNDGNWHHVVSTINYSTGAFNVYIDQTLRITGTNASISRGTADKVQLGTNYGSQFLNGNIDQVRIFNTALTQSQVTQLYQENNSTVGTHLFGCIANYNLDGNAKESMGTTAYDGTETDITYRYDGTPTAVDFGVGGKSNYGARFNGSNSILTAPRMFSTNSSYSISFWAKMATGATNEACLIWQISGTSQRSFGLSYSGSGVTYNFGFNHKFATNTGQNNLASFTPDGNWHHFSGSFDSSTNTGSIYIDGNIQGTTFTLDPVSDTGSTLFIGGTYVYNGVTYYNALSGLDQVRVFNKALSSAEVGKLYGNGAGEIACTYTSTTDNIALPIANTAYYKLDNNSKDSARSTGKFNEGAIFNGSSSGINLPSSLNTSVIDATGAFSISMWINANDLSTIQYLFAAGIANNIDLGINTNNLGTGKIVWTIYNTSYSYLISTTTITTNTWYNIIVTYNNGLSELFINGASQGTITKTLVENSIEPTLGYRNTGGSVRFNGEIDQVRIFDRALDSGEVTQLYNE